MRAVEQRELCWVPEGSLAGFLGCVFEVWPAPGARESLQKGGGLRPQTFLKAFPGPRGRPDLKNAPNKSGQTVSRYPTFCFCDLFVFLKTLPKIKNQANTKQKRIALSRTIRFNGEQRERNIE